MAAGRTGNLILRIVRIHMMDLCPARIKPLPVRQHGSFKLLRAAQHLAQPAELAPVLGRRELHLALEQADEETRILVTQILRDGLDRS
jgi:hypothetical protein